MKVKRNTLLLLAALVWSIAGVNVLRVGMAVYPAYLTVWNTLLSLLVFAVFQQFVFGKLVKKHTARICAYQDERLFFLKVFYTGLGASLLLAGLRFGKNYGRALSAAI